MSCICKDLMFVLEVEDMIGVYDGINGEGAYAKLPHQQQDKIVYGVKKVLNYALGEVWYDYMEESIKLTGVSQ
jgi:hypothetical protein